MSSCCYRAQTTKSSRFQPIKKLQTRTLSSFYDTVVVFTPRVPPGALLVEPVHHGHPHQGLYSINSSTSAPTSTPMPTPTHPLHTPTSIKVCTALAFVAHAAALHGYNSTSFVADSDCQTPGTCSPPDMKYSNVIATKPRLQWVSHRAHRCITIKPKCKLELYMKPVHHSIP